MSGFDREQRRKAEFAAAQFERLKATTASADAFERENAELRELLRRAREKLILYRKAHSGEYVGGMEYSELIRRIDAAL